MRRRHRRRGGGLLARIGRRAYERHPVVIAAAIPHGSSRAPSQARWLAAVEAHPDVATWRADRATGWLAVAREVALCADWAWATTRPTWDRLATLGRYSRRTIARVLAWLRSTGLLGLVATGRSAGVAAMALDDGPDAAVYVLAIPSGLRVLTPAPSPTNTTPGDAAGSGAADELEDTTPTPASMGVDEAVTPSPEGVSARDPRAGMRAKPWPPTTHRPLPTWPVEQRPATKSQMAAAAATAQALCPPLRRTTTPWVVALFRPFWLAGWTLRDVLRALDTRPDGTPWTHTSDIRHVPGWVRTRLAVWLTTAGTPQRSPSQTSAAAQAHGRALARARAERRALEDAHRASTTAATAGAAAARDELRAARAARAARQQATRDGHPS